MQASEAAARAARDLRRDGEPRRAARRVGLLGRHQRLRADRPPDAGPRSRPAYAPLSTAPAPLSTTPCPAVCHPMPRCLPPHAPLSATPCRPSISSTRCPERSRPTTTASRQRWVRAHSTRLASHTPHTRLTHARHAAATYHVLATPPPAHFDTRHARTHAPPSLLSARSPCMLAGTRTPTRRTHFLYLLPKMYVYVCV